MILNISLNIDFFKHFCYNKDDDLLGDKIIVGANGLFALGARDHEKNKHINLSVNPMLKIYSLFYCLIYTQGEQAVRPYALYDLQKYYPIRFR